MGRLRRLDIGRLGVNAEHYPLIVPVSYGLDRDVTVVRTHPGTTLTAARNANVSFEVDEERTAHRSRAAAAAVRARRPLVRGGRDVGSTGPVIDSVPGSP
jgi:nitroimidazol reductase NimA-like FMN-containing flavoprotein (pyridoxamine 5'-phosphate oxidase superfamily)